jgi:hypothetical protein
VTRINEQPIERPGEAYAVFVGLKTAPRLDIEYLRGGRPMRLSLPIVGDPALPKEPAAKAKSTSESSSEGPAPKVETTVAVPPKKP